jgi:hypothetical protein
MPPETPTAPLFEPVGVDQPRGIVVGVLDDVVEEDNFD